MVDLSNIFNLYNPQIPTIFDDSLSYLEKIGRLRGGLELVTKQSNENEANLNKKVSHDEMIKTYKIDKNANFTGSWHGLEKPTLSDEGLKATVEKTVKEVAKIDENITLLDNNKMNKNYKIKSTDLDSSSDSSKIKLVNLSDEVKRAMTGETPVSPEIGDKEVTSEKLADYVLRENHIPAELKKTMTTINRENVLLNPTFFDLGSEWTLGTNTEKSNIEIDGFKTIKITGSNYNFYQSVKGLPNNTKYYVSVDFTLNTATARVAVLGYRTGVNIDNISASSTTNKNGKITLEFTTNSARYDEYRIAFYVIGEGVCYFAKPLLCLESSKNKSFTIDEYFVSETEKYKNEIMFNPNNIMGDKGSPSGWNLENAVYSDVLMDGFKTIMVQAEGTTVRPYKGVTFPSYNGKFSCSLKARVILNEGYSYPVTMELLTIVYKSGTTSGGTPKTVKYTIEEDGDYTFYSTTDNYVDAGRLHLSLAISSPNVRVYINQATAVYGDKIEAHSLRNLLKFEDEGKTDLTNKLDGKVISFNGDSISANNGGYGKIIAERNNMIYENISVGGGTITAETYYLPENYPELTEPKPRHWVCRTIDKMRDDADYIILEGAINDFWNKVPLGTITPNYTSQLNDTTFCGAFESMLKQAVIKYKGKKIGFVITHKITNTFYPYGNSKPGQFELFYEKMIEVLNKWSIPYIDLFKYSGLNTNIPEIKNLYTQNGDGTHPNTKGYELFYVPKIEAWLLTL